MAYYISDNAFFVTERSMLKTQSVPQEDNKVDRTTIYWCYLPDNRTDFEGVKSSKWGN